MSDIPYWYKLLTDPAWQSIGAIISGAGVFIGAWYGTKLANDAKDKSEKVDLEQTKKVYLQILDDEITRNKKLVEKMKGYLTINPPILNAFDALVAGASHLQFTTWNQLVASKVFHLLSLDQQIGYQVANQSVRNLVSHIDMEVAEWKRIYEFHHHYKNNPPKEMMQISNIKDILQNRTMRIETELDETLSVLNILVDDIENCWLKENR